MIGISNGGRLIVESIKMFQADWDLGYKNTRYYPGYHANIVSFHLMRSFKTFLPNNVFMWANSLPTYITIASGTYSSLKCLYEISDRNDQTFTNFFDQYPTCFQMLGFQNNQSEFVDSGFQIVWDSAPRYQQNDLKLMYCYINVSYFLTPAY